MDDGGENGARFRRIPALLNQSPRTLSSPPRTKPTAGQYSQRDGALFSCGIFALDVLYAVRFCDLEQRRDVAKVGPNLVRDRRIVVCQDVDALSCGWSRWCKSRAHQMTR